MGFNRPVFIQGSTWGIENILQLPVDSVLTNTFFVYINTFQLLFRVVVQLDQLFSKKTNRMGRSKEREQMQLFRHFERSLATIGIDGRSCMLRTICELQKRPIDHYSIMGEIVTVLMTPKRGANNFLREYLEAETVGLASNRSCRIEYAKCPVSVFNILGSYSTPEDKWDHQEHHLTDEVPMSMHPEQLTASDHLFDQEEYDPDYYNDISNSYEEVEL